MINCLQKSTNIVKTSKTIIIGIRIIAKPPSILRTILYKTGKSEKMPSLITTTNGQEQDEVPYIID
jgi:hypothetical protein